MPLAGVKRDALHQRDLKKRAMVVIGTCVAGKGKVEGNTPKEFLAEINAGNRARAT